MKKILLLAGLALCLGISSKTNAQVRVNLNLGVPVVRQSYYAYGGGYANAPYAVDGCAPVARRIDYRDSYYRGYGERGMRNFDRGNGNRGDYRGQRGYSGNGYNNNGGRRR